MPRDLYWRLRAEVAGPLNPLDQKWRVGRRVGRTIYLDDGDPDPNDGSLLIGVMDTSDLAREAVEAHNARLSS